jgi:PilZ domain
MNRGGNDARTERRRHPRFELGLPVTLNVLGRGRRFVVELVELSLAGARFRGGEELRVNDRAAFEFVIPADRHCRATGRCVRTRERGEFALSLDTVNPAYVAFVDDLAGEGEPHAAHHP